MTRGPSAVVEVLGNSVTKSVTFCTPCKAGVDCDRVKPEKKVLSVTSSRLVVQITTRNSLSVR